MKRLSDHTGIFETESERLQTIFDDWQPRSFDLPESEHEADLFAALRRALPDVPMTTQHGLAKGRADIVIEDSHVIEVKLGLTDIDQDFILNPHPCRRLESESSFAHVASGKGHSNNW